MFKSRSVALPRGVSAWMAAALVTATGGCESYPDLDSRWDDDIVVTAYDSSADFADYKTFSVDPTVHLIKELDDGGAQRSDLPDKYAQPIVAQIVENMKAIGYEEVDSDADPDLGITVTALNTEVSGTVSGWWGYGGWWGYPGWGYYYPYAYSYSYRRGSLVTEMVDLTGPAPDVPDGGLADLDGGLPDLLDAGLSDRPMGLPVVWASVGYQVLSSSGKPNVSVATDSIDQAFEQSPYLGGN